MATAKKTSSGNWRIQILDYIDAEGKKHKKSFTASTKKEAEYQAAQYLATREDHRPENISVGEAIRRYIDSKAAVLSPSTIRGYRSLEKTAYEGISRQRINKLNNTIVQVWISRFSDGRTPKTVRNAFGLLISALDMFAPDLRLKVTLPQKQRPELYTPSDDDIKLLLDHIKGKELEIAVMLAAFGPLRRGEICALESSDIHGRTVSVSKSMVLDADKTWRIKPPKTYGGYREIDFPQFVINRMAGIQGRIIQATPDQITHRFRRALKSAHLPDFRFHDLRHYSAAIMHVVGMSDQYIMRRGGWSSDHVMKSVYRNVIDLEVKRQDKMAEDHFQGLVSDGSRKSSHLTKEM